MTYEGKPMIENSDRGVTLAKPLAWSMLCSVVAAIWYGASTVANLNSTTQAVAAALASLQAVNIQIDVRVRALESGAATAVARFEALSSSMEELKDGQREMQGLLRQALRESLQERTP